MQEDLSDHMLCLRRKHQPGSNSVIHNMMVVAQFLKKQGRAGLTRAIDLPQPAQRSSHDILHNFKDLWRAMLISGRNCSPV
jgi:hypothetical protein